MYNREPVQLNRSVEAVLIPAGTSVVIPEGTEVNVAQSLGGSVTLYVSGNLVRVSGRDLDAIGMEPRKEPELPEDASDEELSDFIWDRMKTCYDPEIPINIVDLGLVYNCEMTPLEDNKVRVNVEMTLTAPGCGMGDIIAYDVKDKLEAISRVEEARVDLVFDPPWDQSMMSEAARLQTGMM